ncbi:MAG TPA: nitronate monooxygenase, partial [Acidimicrobiia bacterium]|nr:nitronate monooxygenase [Acidimicrobiia bacterium]
MAGRFPVIIQGGMGVGVSGWQLARAVSANGQLGVVSGTALDAVLVRRLQAGDPGGHVRRALAAFPVLGVADRIVDRYFTPEGKAHDTRFMAKPMPRAALSSRLEELIVAANFVEVALAKESHSNPVGINYLEKIQSTMLPSLYGAMLAGVDYVLVGAGIPRAIPRALDQLANGEPVELKIDLKGGGADDGLFSRFDPVAFTGGALPPVRRPLFLAIVSSHVLATMLAQRVEPPVDGFVVEGPTAGGHNAPPRGKLGLNAAGEPIYGDRDAPDLDAIRGLGLPFWLAGSYAHPDRVQAALAEGAEGVQVGTAFAYCEESGLDPEIKRQVLKMSRDNEVSLVTDPVASPTGFPFKVVQIAGTLSDDERYESRDRKCDLGYLRTAYRDHEGKIGWRCPAEPVDD